MSRDHEVEIVTMSLLRCVLVGGVMSAALSTAHADDFGDRLRKMPPPAFTTEKSLAALEWCIGTGIGAWMPPATLHGEGRLLVFGIPALEVGFAPVFIMVQITDDGTRRMLAFSAHKGWDEKTAALIRSCL